MSSQCTEWVPEMYSTKAWGESNQDTVVPVCVEPYKSYKPVIKFTIPRWMKTIIHEAGNGELFSAHSVKRSCSHSCSHEGNGSAWYFEIADWSSDNVFKAFNYRPTEGSPRFLLNTYQKINLVSYTVCDYACEMTIMISCKLSAFCGNIFCQTYEPMSEFSSQTLFGWTARFCIGSLLWTTLPYSKPEALKDNLWSCKGQQDLKWGQNCMKSWWSRSWISSENPVAQH